MLADTLSTTLPDDLRRAREHLRSGRVAEARGVLSLLPASDDARLTVLALAFTLECELARGDLSRAETTGTLLEAFLAVEGPARTLACCALGELSAADGDAETAAARFLEAGASIDADLDDPDLVPWRSGAAMALTYLRRHREAAVLAQEELALARRTGSTYAEARALRTMAATTMGDGRIALLRQARALLEGDVRAERLAAQIDTDLAALATLQADLDTRDEAIRLLRSAEAYAGREDLFPLQNRVRHLLQRLGEKPRRIRSETLAKLTAKEQRAATMAADGLTNREIAEQMTVTVKAVEWHLSHVYRKLGVPNRTELAETLGTAV